LAMARASSGDTVWTLFVLSVIVVVPFLFALVSAH
jgi:hypothetical protein